ncbi:MAG: ketoacyl-ACP synthase III [Chthonomonadaceae bacterium]|nr:ketoacyl-ACP synthase III [Chthonomonadaceae bacterium]
MRAVIEGIGHSVPEKKLTNEDLERLVDTSDEWIVQRTGIKERRITSPGEAASTLGIVAAQEALEESGTKPEDIQLVICGTVTGDYQFPSTSCLIQEAIGAKKAGAFDVGAACAGFIYALDVAGSMVESGRYETVLVIGVDVLTKFVDWKDRATCVLFGDGAGAVVLKGQTGTDRGLVKSLLLSDGSGAKHIHCQMGGSMFPAGSKEAEGDARRVYMNGSEVYRFAVNAMGDACCKVLEAAGMEPGDVDLFVPHQANLRIIQSAQKRLGLDDERVFINVQHYGNTSGGSIPLGLYEAQKQGRLKKGDLVLTVGFGAGLVWGANLIRW